MKFKAAAPWLPFSHLEFAFLPDYCVIFEMILESIMHKFGRLNVCSSITWQCVGTKRGPCCLP